MSTAEVTPAREPPPEPTASDVATAPLPKTESGRLDPVDRGDGIARFLGRGLLFVPRIAMEIVAQPLRGVLYLKDRYEPLTVISSWFTTEDRRIAIFPTVLSATGFGLAVGVRAQFFDLFRAGERLSFRAATGGEFRRAGELRAVIGDRKRAQVAAGIHARYEERDQDRFYGYGNADTRSPPVDLIDPTVSDVAVGTRYQLKTGRVATFVTARPARGLAITGRATVIRDDVTSAEPTGNGSVLRDRPIASFYDTAALPGFGRRDSIYSELEVTWDTGRPAHDFDPTGMRATGGLVSVFGGQHNTLDGGVNFLRGGVDLQRFIPLTRGPRAIELRGSVEAVTGARDQLPFLELPKLGGPRFLRGYDRDRFRDRIAAVAHAGYLFSLSRSLAASLFVDVGRVYAGADELTWRDQRVGFGGAVELYNTSSMVFRAEVAGSIDGSLYLYFSLDPAYEARARTDRR